MKAAILSAGEGRRLRNILGGRPKALLEICGVPLIERVISSLIKNDIRDLVVIIRKDAIQLKEFLEKRKKKFAAEITIIQKNILQIKIINKKSCKEFLYYINEMRLLSIKYDFYST